MISLGQASRRWLSRCGTVKDKRAYAGCLLCSWWSVSRRKSVLVAAVHWRSNLYFAAISSSTSWLMRSWTVCADLLFSKSLSNRIFGLAFQQSFSRHTCFSAGWLVDTQYCDGRYSKQHPAIKSGWVCPEIGVFQLWPAIIRLSQQSAFLRRRQSHFFA